MPAPRNLARGAALILTGALAACADTGPAGLDFTDLETGAEVETCQPDFQIDGGLLEGTNDDLLDGPKGKKGGWGGALKLNGGTTSSTGEGGDTAGTTGSISGTTLSLTGAKSTDVDAAVVGTCPS